MKKIIPIKLILLSLALLVITVSLQTAVAQDTSIPLPETQSIAASGLSEIVIMAEETISPPTAIAAPDFGMNLNAVQTATIQVNYIDKATTWDTAPGAEAAFQYAVNIWASLISSPVPIVINANWENLSVINPGILGSAGATTISVNNGSFPYANTWYPAALANALAGNDLNGSTAEITARFNSERSDWYFGTDMNTPFAQYNFTTVVLHEIGHGLGFFGSMNYNNGIGSWGYTSSGNSTYPIIYDRFTENGFGQSLLTFENPSVSLGSELTSNYLFFDGPNTRLENGGGTASIYAPEDWRSGSSYSHLGEAYNGTINALMTYSLTNGETNYNPGPLALAMLKDMGWNITKQAAKLEQLPGQLLPINTNHNNVFDVTDYTDLGTYEENGLTYTMTDSGAAQAGISFTNSTISINPDLNWTGKTTATIQVLDPVNQPSSSTFFVVVADPIYEVYLPAILR